MFSTAKKRNLKDSVTPRPYFAEFDYPLEDPNRPTIMGGSLSSTSEEKSNYRSKTPDPVPTKMMPQHMRDTVIY